MEIAKGKIGNALTSTASDHVVAVTADIYDEKQERYQEDINEYLLNHANDINDSLCCFSEGIWENNLYWSDVTVWDNNKYALTDALSERINTLSETHQTDTRAINQHLTEIDEELLQNGRKHDAFNTHLEKHDGEIKALQKLIAEHDQQITDLLYALSCFNSGQWKNDFKWSNETLWENSNFMCNNESAGCECPIDTGEQLETLHDNVANLQSGLSETDTKVANNEEIIAQHQDNLSSLNAAVDNNSSEIEEIKQAAVKEHRSVAYQFRAMGRDQVAQDEKIAKIGEHFNCFADGIWNDMFIWDNEQLWANQTGVLKEALDDLQSSLHDTRQKLHEANEDIMTNLSLIQANHQLIENNAEAIQENETAINDLRGQFGCVEQGEWGNPYFWNNEDLWIDNPNGLVEIETEVIEHNDRITVLEAQFASFMQQFTAQQSIISQQQAQLETLMDCFTVLNVGKWQNLLLWDNTSKWSDALITEVAGDSGVASVAVKSYDPETATVSI